MDLRDEADIALTERVPNGCAGPTRTVRGPVLVGGKLQCSHGGRTPYSEIRQLTDVSNRKQQQHFSRKGAAIALTD